MKAFDYQHKKSLMRVNCDLEGGIAVGDVLIIDSSVKFIIDSVAESEVGIKSFTIQGESSFLDGLLAGLVFLTDKGTKVSILNTRYITRVTEYSSLGD